MTDDPASFWSPTATLSAVKRTVLAMALLLTSVFGVTGCGSDDDVDVESRVKNVAPEAQEAPEASGASDALSKADCDVFDFLDDPDLRYLRYVLDLLDRSDLLDIVDDGLSQDLIDLYNLLDLGPGDLVDTLNRSDLRDLLDRLGRGDLLDRLGLLDARDIYTFEDIFGFWGIDDLRDDLRDGLRGVLDQCAAASKSDGVDGG